MHETIARKDAHETDSRYAWMRLGIAVVLSTIGGVGMWSFTVVLPVVQAEFGVSRAEASLPYTLTMMAFAGGSVLMGQLVDRFGIVRPVIGAAVLLCLGYVACGYAPNLMTFAIAHGVLIGLGTSATFGPLVADVSHWFVKRRGLAIAICASGNYIAGTIWSPVVQHLISTVGWRPTYLGLGLFCLVTMLPLAFLLRRGAPTHEDAAQAPSLQGSLGLSPNTLMALLAIASVACCVAMSMPQVHIVAYCGDLGYGPARGSEMLSLMLALGIVSRIGSGWIADRVGGLATILLGSTAQAASLALYMFFDGLTSLYVISALFGLVQGGIVPAYAIVVREYFPAKEAATRVGIVLMASILGMALGGWLSGAIFDLTGSYRAAFANGVIWNLLNIAIALFLMLKPTRRVPAHA